MTSKDPLPKIGKDQACKSCREHKTRSVRHGSNTCEQCRERNITCQLPSSKQTIVVNKKRRKEDSSAISDSETIEATSAGTSSHALNVQVPTHAPAQKKPRSSKKSSSKPLESRPSAPPAEQNKSSNDCGICQDERGERQSWKNQLGGDTEKWIRCDIKTCCSWYHLSCLCVLLSKEPEHMLFCPGPSHGRALFVCPKCLEQPKKGYDKAVTQAMKTFISTIENLKKQTILEEQSTPESSIHVKSALEYKNEDKTKKEAVKDLWMGEDPVMEFDIVREERYNSFDDNLVYDLLRNLHQYIYDYDIEIGDAIERFGNESDLRMKEPLRAWKLVDVNEGIVTGQQWFRIDDVTTKQPTCHAPITAALRSILNTSDDKPLGIALNLKSLTFSQVHIGLVNWFVFDVLNNKINLYELPNMRSMRAMMTAVRGSGEARWPKKGRHLLGEVQLRTWYKLEFQQALLLNEGNFRQRLEAFLEPLTRGFDRISAWSLGRANIIHSTLKLWSYLQSLQGRLVMIQPAIGSPFDSNLHEAYDQEGLQQYPEKNSKKKILWVLRRGFRYEEDGMEEPRVLTIKARVVIQ